MLERYGQVAMSRLDKSQLLAVSQSKRRAAGVSRRLAFDFIGVENAFSSFRLPSRSTGGAQRCTWQVVTKWRTGMELAQ